MVYIHIKNDKEGDPHELINKLNAYTSKKNNKIFILFYMEGCGPCNETKPEWSKLQNELTDKFLKRDNIVIVMVDQAFLPKLKNLKSEPRAYPTMRYMNNGTEETFEDSQVPENKERTIDNFIKWIEYKTGENDISEAHKKQKGVMGKWSRKYKRSINCKRPRGFSQKQYCKYGRKKTKKRRIR